MKDNLLFQKIQSLSFSVSSFNRQEVFKQVTPVYLIDHNCPWRQGYPFCGSSVELLQCWNDAAKVWHWRWQTGRLYFCRAIPHHDNDLSPQSRPPSLICAVTVFLSDCSCSPCLSADACTSHPAMPVSLLLFQYPRHYSSQLTFAHTLPKVKYHNREGQISSRRWLSLVTRFISSFLCVLLFFLPQIFSSCPIRLAALLWRSQLKSGRIFNTALS